MSPRFVVRWKKLSWITEGDPQEWAIHHGHFEETNVEQEFKTVEDMNLFLKSMKSITSNFEVEQYEEKNS